MGYFALWMLWSTFSCYVGNKIIYLLDIQALVGTVSFCMQYSWDSSSFFTYYQISARP